MKLQSFAEGKWVQGQGDQVPLYNAVNGELVGEASSQGVDFKAMLDFARRVGGPNLRSLTFHQRAEMLKSLARYLTEHKEEFYRLSAATGATRTDSWMDIDGVTGDDSVARKIVTGIAPHHGRLMIINRDCAGESTGHGAALPELVHGGPGRAGGGEELGGIRAVFHFMQRTALQGSPETLAAIVRGGSES